MKKTWITFTAALLIMSSHLSFAAEKSRLNEILERGTLRVGTTGDWNPMSIKNPAKDNYEGFDIDVTTELAKDLGVEVEYVATDWKTLINGIVANQYDMTGSASLSMSRAKVAGYSRPYFYLAFVPVIQKKQAELFQNWPDFDKDSVIVAATLGTVQEKMIKTFFPKAKHTVVEAPARDYQELLSGRANAVVTSNIEAATLVKKFPQLTTVSVSEPRNPTPISMLLPQKDQVWINYVNHWIELKQTQGFFKKTAKKWGINAQE